MAKPEPEHPSFFALDGLKLGSADAGDLGAAAAHVRDCPSCAAYVGEGKARKADPAPAWLTEAVWPPPPPANHVPRRRWTRLWPSLPALALAASVLVLVGRAPRGTHETAEQASAVREKGTPALRVFVKRGLEVFPWDGHDPVRVDDRLRFEIHGAGPGFISVASRPPGGKPPVVLYTGPLGAGVQLLPLSFRVDAEAGAEVVSVITAQRPIAPELHAVADDALAGPDPWRQILVFTKGRAE